MNCSKAENQTETELMYPKTFFIGTYTSGESEGIYSIQLDENGRFDSLQLRAQSSNPSFLAFDDSRTYLLAVNENANGSIESYRINETALTKIDTRTTEGAHPCFVTINQNGKVLVTNYTGGNVILTELDDSGNFTSTFDSQQHTGGGSHSRQDAPHPHSAWFLPKSNEIIAVDLGTNELWIYQINNEGTALSFNTKLQMPANAGPRHLAIHPNQEWIYVLNELSGSVSLVEKTSNIWSITQTISSLPNGFADQNTSADIHISDDGKFVYASNRGHNSLAIYSVNGINGELELIGFESVRGEGPRNFKITSDDEFVIVANQYTNSLISFKRNTSDGSLLFIDSVSVPNPVCILEY